MTAPPAPDPDELRRLVEEASRAAREAQAAAASAAGAAAAASTAPRPDAAEPAREQPSAWKEALDGVSRLIATLVDALYVRLRAEVDHARRAGEDLLARVLRALSRSLRHLGGALAFGAAGLLVLAVAVAVLGVALVAILNAALGDPWGTLVAGVLLLVVALVLLLLARGRLSAIEDEARAVSPRLR